MAEPVAKFETAEIPFQTVGNRQCLTGLQLMQEPWLQDFVNRFPACFEYAVNMDVVLFYPDGDAPNG